MTHEPVDVKPGGHGDEAGDVRAIRAYTSNVDGKNMHIVRGDFHRHTELSWDGGGTGDGNLQDFYRYMIDVAAMDFGASTDHQGGGWPYWWWYTQKMTDMYHVPGALCSDLRLRAQRDSSRSVIAMCSTPNARIRAWCRSS